MTSESPASPSSRPRLNAVGIVVTDMATSIAFYSRLGVTFGEEGAAGEDHTEADLGGVRLMLDTEASIAAMYPGWSAGGPGRISLAAELATPDAVDSLYADLAADGFDEREPWDAFWGQRYASVHDPDGNSVDLYAPLPTAPADGAPDVT